MSDTPPLLTEKVRKKILLISKINGGAITILAGLLTLLLLAVTDWLGATICALITSAGAMELYGRSLLEKNDAAGARLWLLRSQLWLFSIIALYCISQLVGYDEAELRKGIPEIDRALAPAGTSVAAILSNYNLDVPKGLVLFKKFVYILYSAVIAGSLLHQGLLWLYYRWKLPAPKKI